MARHYWAIIGPNEMQRILDGPAPPRWNQMMMRHDGRFQEIDVLRGLAAIVVVLSHYVSYCSRYLGYGQVNLEHYGYYAVELFFMISGFVIYFTLEKCQSWRDFAFSRMTRLYPTYWASLTLMVVAEITIFHGRMSPSSGIEIWPAGYLANMTMLQEFFGFTNFDNVFWSLTVEVAFYILMAVLFSLRWLGRIEIVAICLLAVASLWPAPAGDSDSGVAGIVTRFLILPYLPFFMGGIMFYRLASGGFSTLRVAVLIAALGVEWWLHGPLNLCVAVAIFVVFGLAVGGYLRGLVAPPTLWLGAISYPLYLSHRNLGYSTMLKLHEAGIPTGLVLLVTIAGALTLAAALSYLVERPALQALRQWYRTRLAAVA